MLASLVSFLPTFLPICFLSTITASLFPPLFLPTLLTPCCRIQVSKKIHKVGEEKREGFDWELYKSDALPERLYEEERGALSALVPVTVSNEWLITFNTVGKCAYLLGDKKVQVVLDAGDVMFMDAHNVEHGVESRGDRVGLVVWEGKAERTIWDEGEERGVDAVGDLFSDDISTG